MKERVPLYDVSIKVVDVCKNRCNNGHKVGDEWIMRYDAPEHLCAGAFHAIFPMAWMLQLGASFPLEEDPDVAHVSCPDHNVQVIYEIRRLPQK